MGIICTCLHERRYTVKCRNMNVRYWESAKIGTNAGSDFDMFQFQLLRPYGTCQICQLGPNQTILDPIVQNLNDLVQVLDIFSSVWALKAQTEWSVRNPNDFVLFVLILVQLSDVQKCPKSAPSKNGTEVNRPRTKLVRTLDSDCMYF